MARKLRITTGRSRYDRNLKRHEAGWPALVKKLTEFTITDESFVDYVNAGNDKLAIKDVGWYVGGHFEPNVRRRDNLVSRSILTLDADHLEPGDDVLSAYSDLELVWHTSHSHSPETPRLRLVFPLSRDVTPEEYEPLARAVAAMAGMDYFDDTCYQVSRIMFWPSCSSDGEHDAGRQEGDWLDPDFVLGLTYSDPNDFGEWPLSSREKGTGGMQGSLRKAQPPWDKPGVIGAFNRVYDIPTTIEVFGLPYVLSGMGEGRYSYAEGSSVDGAIYYPDTGHLFSWHESDPAKGNNTAWDLVRIHLFGDLDEGVSKDTPIQDRPSQLKMKAFAQDLKPVILEIDGDEFDFVDGSIEEAKAEVAELISAARRSSREVFESLHDELTSDCPSAGPDTTDFLRKIAAARLEPTEEDALLSRIKEFNGTTKKSMQDTLRDLKKGIADVEERDAQAAIIDHVLSRHYGGGIQLRRVHGMYWVYDHGKWRIEDDERVKGCIQYEVQLLKEQRPDDYRDLVIAVGEQTLSSIVPALNSVMIGHLAHREAEDGGDDPLRLRKPKPSAMNCLNGEVWFTEEGAEFREHDPRNFFTTQLDVEYDPKAECPEWDRFCSILFGDSVFPDDLQRHLEELGGYIMQMRRHLKTIVFFHGRSNSGKTTIGKVFSSMLGDAMLGVTFKGFEDDSHATASLQGKLLMMDDDMSRNDALDDGFLKRISEAKLVTVNPKNKDRYTLLSLALPLVISNGLPRIKSQDEAIANRLLVLEFPRIIPEEERNDARAEAMIDGERSGILNRFVEGYRRLQERGGWDVPQEWVQARDDWMRDANPVARWLHECFDHTGSASDFLPRAGLHQQYKNWMVDQELGRFVKGKSHFHEALRDLVGNFTKRQGVVGVAGYVRNVDEFDEEDAD